MPKIDVARLNTLKPKPKPSENPPETVGIPSDDGEDLMEVDRVPMGRTLRKRKEKVEKHLKRGANDKKKESFPKRVFRIPIDKPFEEAYYTHRLWMFFRETRKKEEDIKRMFCEAREKMRKRVTLKKKSDPGKFTIPCTVKGIEFPHAFGEGREAARGRFRSRKSDEFRRIALVSTPDYEHRSTDPSPNRSTGSPEHRSMTPMESTTSCNAVRIMTHEEFTA
ncbi:hypothetical protein F2Q68_00034622 [Brassica cretica]|uniref:Uncharacterized protein n=1 Tax=Brassica cretica TaxID=69181 RepID=A0A8S9H6I5_BRACR|nr:hypothetical protein F2Q68_00034622 [Brassica cretica]